MAIPDHIRAEKRSASHRMTRKKAPSRTSALADRRRGSPTALKPQDVRLHLSHLRYIHAAAVTATAALMKQNADLDADIALTLRHAVTNPLMTEIEKLEARLGDAKEGSC